jgi:hypothetical protein
VTIPGAPTPCPVCFTSADVNRNPQFLEVSCPRCGSFSLAREAAHALERIFKQQPLCASLMSNALRRMQRKSSVLVFLPDLDSLCRSERLPTPKERADSLILWIGDNQVSAESPTHASALFLDAWIGSALPRMPGDAEGLRWLIDQIQEQKLFTCDLDADEAQFSLTFDGWERYAALKQKTTESRTAFMAMKFGQSDLDRVVEICFRPAVARAGFVLRLVTDNQPAGLIDDQMKASILASRFVIADLTHGSAGAYWEAGFGEGLGLPVIYSCEKSAWEKQKTHFDTNHYKTILWDSSNLRSAGDELTATIRATLRTEAKLTDS